MILEQEVEELLQLCLLVSTKTTAYVSFEVMSHTKGCHIYIQDKGYDPDAEFDGDYTIYFDSEFHEKSSRKIYEGAKEHLVRLLKENGS